MSNPVKDQIKREDLKENIMKKVIFSIYYPGVVEPEFIINLFKDNFKDHFGDLETFYAGNLDSDLYNFDEISESLSLPGREILNHPVFRFSENKFGKDTVILDIGKYFSVLIVECDKYEGIDLYLDFFSKYIDFMNKEILFFKIKSLRLRKLGGNIYFDSKEIFNDFEKEYFNFNFDGTKYQSKNSIYKDILECDSPNEPTINYIRSFDTGDYYDLESNEIKRAFQVLLDIDSYYNEEALEALDLSYESIKKLLEKTNTVHLFEIFKMSVTEQFLNSNSHD